MPNTDVTAHFHRKLYFVSSSDTAGTVTDGNWTLNCTRSKGKTALTLPNNCVVGGSGDMDLSGPISDQSGVAYTITSFSGGPFSSTKDSNPVTSFYSPTTTVSISYNLFNGHTHITNAMIRSSYLTSISQNTFLNCSALQEARFEAPNLVTTKSEDAGMNANQFTQCTSLQRIVLKLPALVEMKRNFASAAYGDTDLSTWDLSSVTNLTGSVMSVLGGGSGPHGILSLPSLVNLEQDSFCYFSSVSGYRLGTESLKRVAGQAFTTLKGTSRIELGIAEGFVCSANSFGNDDMVTLTNLVFTGSVTPTEEALENILTKVPLLTSASSQRPAVFIPVLNREWVNWFATPTETEKASYYPDWIPSDYRLLGIASSSRRAAWAFTNSPKFPKGFMMIFR